MLKVSDEFNLCYYAGVIDTAIKKIRGQKKMLIVF